MQLYVFAPILLLPLHFYPKQGLWLNLFAILVVVAVDFGVAYDLKVLMMMFKMYLVELKHCFNTDQRQSLCGRLWNQGQSSRRWKLQFALMRLCHSSSTWNKLTLSSS